MNSMIRMVDADGRTFAFVATTEDAQLIKAAPTLLAACKAIIADQDSEAEGSIIDRAEERAGCECPYCQAVRLCRAAVAMADRVDAK